MLKSSLSDYSDAYLLVSRTVTVVTQAGDNPSSGGKDVVMCNV